MLRNKYFPLFVISGVATIGLFVLLGYKASQKNIKPGQAVAPVTIANEAVVIEKAVDSIKNKNNEVVDNFNSSLQNNEIEINATNPIEPKSVNNVNDLKNDMDNILEYPNTYEEVNVAKNKQRIMVETIDVLKIKKKESAVKKKQQLLHDLDATYQNEKKTSGPLVINSKAATKAYQKQIEIAQSNKNGEILENAQLVNNTSDANSNIKNKTQINSKNKNTKPERTYYGLSKSTNGAKSTSVIFSTLQDNQNLSETANLVKSIKGSFDFTAQQSLVNNTVFLVITMPNGEVMRKSDWDVGVFTTSKGERKMYTQVFKFDYEKGTTQKLDYDFETSDLMPGEYTLEIYQNAVSIHKVTKTLF